MRAVNVSSLTDAAMSRARLRAVDSMSEVSARCCSRTSATPPIASATPTTRTVAIATRTRTLANRRTGQPSSATSR